MRAMVFKQVGAPLEPADLTIPEPDPGQLLIRVHVCGLCRTDLHLLDGEVAIAAPPRVLGHQIVGTVERAGGEERGLEGGRSSEAHPRQLVGSRVGVPWLGWSDGSCRFCRSGRENLCVQARFTGRDIDGGMAEYAVADSRYCFPIPDGYPDLQAAPLLCAGLIGYRALRMCGYAERVGLYGFGAAAHIICQVATWQGRRVLAFTRDGDEAGQQFARELGAEWAGGSSEAPPEPLDAAIIFAPVGALVPTALRALERGGVVVCAGIHMSQIPAFDYELLWEERRLVSVANLTRQDGHEFLELALRVPVETQVTTYALEQATEGLDDLRHGRFRGAGVLRIGDSAD